MPQEWGAYQFPELRRAPGIVLDETIRDGLAKVLLKAVGERALRLLELWSGEGEPGVFVLAHVLQFLHVLAHLVQKILCVLVIGVDAALKLLLRWGCGGVGVWRRGGRCVSELTIQWLVCRFTSCFQRTERGIRAL